MWPLRPTPNLLTVAALAVMMSCALPDNGMPYPGLGGLPGGTPIDGLPSDPGSRYIRAGICSQMEPGAFDNATEKTFFPPTAVPSQTIEDHHDSVELGLRFQSQRDGFIKAVRFYKVKRDLAPHSVSLWDPHGELLARVPVKADTGSGWRQVDFPCPIPVARGLKYVASYHSSGGFYPIDRWFFADKNGLSSGPLYAPYDGEAGLPNGIYHYGAAAYPTNTYTSNNYWVDVVFLGQ